MPRTKSSNSTNRDREDKVIELEGDALAAAPLGEDKDETCKRSLFRGVSWKKSSNKWQAQIRAEGKKRCLGYFDDEVAAAQAYDRYAVEHGLASRLNFTKSELQPTASATSAASESGTFRNSDITVAPVFQFLVVRDNPMLLVWLPPSLPSKLTTTD